MKKYIKHSIKIFPHGKTVEYFTINPNHPDNQDCGGQGVINKLLGYKRND